MSVDAKTVRANGRKATATCVIDVTTEGQVEPGRYAVTSQHLLGDTAPGTSVHCGGVEGTYAGGTERGNEADIGLVRVDTSAEWLNVIGLPGGGTHNLSRYTKLAKADGCCKASDGFYIRPGLRVIVHGVTTGPREAFIESVNEDGCRLKIADGGRFEPGDSGAPVVIHPDPKANYTDEVDYNAQLDSHAGELLAMLVGRFEAAETSSVAYFFSSSLSHLAPDATLVHCGTRSEDQKECICKCL